MAQLEDHGALHPDAHMFFMKKKEEHSDTVTAIITQLFLKARFKEWEGRIRQ